MTLIDREKAIAELQELADEEGITLPWPAAVIVGIEARGGYVNLATGLIGRATERVRLTALGEARAAQRGGKRGGGKCD